MRQSPRICSGRELRRQQGLTLFELLIVLAIIALLATLIAPRVVGYLGKAKSDIARGQLANLTNALELYALDAGEYPLEADGLGALIERPDAADFWDGPYLREETALIDPWGRAYLYELDDDGRRFVVRTLGRDGAEGGDGEDADLERR